LELYIRLLEQPMDMHITENVKGYLISGNHRHALKEYVRKNYHKLFASEPHWNLTLTQILVGLSPDQAIFLANVDNEKEKIQSADSMFFEIKIFNTPHS